MLSQVLETTGNLSVTRNIAREQEIAAEFRNCFCDSLPQTFTLISKGKFRAFPPHRFCDAISDGTIAEQTGDKDAFAGK
jgi:hypothetical protein